MPRKRKARRFPPLQPFAWEAEPFQAPADTVAWKVRINTEKLGRPALVWPLRGVVVGSVSDG